MTLQLETGRWYRRKSGQLAYVIGHTMPQGSMVWYVQVDESGGIFAAYDDGKFYISADAIVEELPDCTGWDCQPPEPKSLGEKLCDATSKGWWAILATVEREEYQRRAEKFLRSALAPPAGMTLEDVCLEAGGDAGGYATETGLRFFLEALTGIKLGANP